MCRLTRFNCFVPGLLREKFREKETFHHGRINFARITIDPRPKVKRERIKILITKYMNGSRKCRISKLIFYSRESSCAYRYDRGRGKRKRRKRHSQNGHPVLFRRDLRRDLSATRRVAADYIDSANEIGVLNGSH